MCTFNKNKQAKKKSVLMYVNLLILVRVSCVFMLCIRCTMMILINSLFLQEFVLAFKGQALSRAEPEQ